jgi:Zn-dependent protease
LADLGIASAGLAVNVLIILVFWNTIGILHWLAALNAYFAVSNLIPLGGSDGQRILRLLRGPSSTPKSAPQRFKSFSGLDPTFW